MRKILSCIFVCILIFILGACNSAPQQSVKQSINYYGFPKDEVNNCLNYQLMLNNCELVKINSTEKASDDILNVYADVIYKEDFRHPQPIRVCIDMWFKHDGTIQNSHIVQIDE